MRLGLSGIRTGLELINPLKDRVRFRRGSVAELRSSRNWKQPPVIDPAYEDFH